MYFNGHILCKTFHNETLLSHDVYKIDKLTNIRNVFQPIYSKNYHISGYDQRALIPGVKCENLAGEGM